MALAFTFLKRTGGGPFSRGIRRNYLEITGDTSYPTGGTAIAASDVGFVGGIIQLRVNAAPTPLTNRLYAWNRSTGKLMAQVISTQAEVGAGVACNADKIQVEAIGY